MARINKKNLALQVSAAAYRADFVRQDPAFTKAAHQAWVDVKQAARSTVVLGQETVAAWHRADAAPGPVSVGG